MDTQTQIERLIELAIVQRTELKELVAQLPQLREHLSTEIEKAFDEAEPQLRTELEEWTTKQAEDKTASLGTALEAKIAQLASNLEISTQARYNAIIAEREQNARIAAQAEAKIAEHAASLPDAVKDIVTAELARFPRAGEIDQLRKEFAEPRGLNPRGKWQVGETYNRLDLVTVNGDSFVSNIDGNKERPSRSAANWTLSAARGTGGGTGFTSLNNVLGDPSAGQIVGSEAGQYVRKTLAAGANITITETASTITIIGDEGQISLQDGTAAAPALFFTSDTDTGIYRPAANQLGISTSGVQRMFVDEDGITTTGAGGTFDGSVHAANGNANNPSFSFTSDQDTGFFHAGTNELGIALGGTQYATLTSTTFSITPVVTMASSLRVNGTTDSSSKDTGAIVTEGGLGVEKSASIGGNLTVSGLANISGNAAVGLGNATADLIIKSSVATGGAGYSEVLFGNTSTPSRGYLSYNHATDALLFGTGGATRSTLDGTGNLSLAGNLTVSGTSNRLATMAEAYSSSGDTYLQINRDDATKSRWRFATNGANFELQDNYNVRVPIAIVGNTMATTLGGNLTVSGTGTSNVGGTLVVGSASAASGSGKLELATHTTSAGGIGFGTDTSLYRYGAGRLAIEHVGGVDALLFWSNSGTLRALGEADGSTNTFRIGSLSAGWSTAIVSGNNTTALTLDSSQNATFAGDLTVSGGNVGVGTAADANRGISLESSMVGSSNSQYGMVSAATFTSAVTNIATAFYGKVRTAAGSFTLTSGRAFEAESPTLGANSAITTQIGLLVNNQGAAGVTHAYGLDIAAQSGAATTNVAIRAAGKIMFTSLPTSSAGLASGELWNDSGTVKIA